ncbi:hypothetical protein AUEXF2481DRAFT_36774 [Aureobasidium subglaciale EXF-2481]|uniref:Uncharacterized protein n=1 Tax=Aureobasidium subglaciale (strain EXF-2481) TaxID=1043005 RepID=A0A074ZI81_AURSE|nr:uncharacterized protein AUEXF2481DRAFT_36774 [Aureobasidium subglaciale EXF-2481]KEQ98266.1 hypothetical protein AUEXF2481DRAFT_36774 [Aureobasidium subglaciale EXF-2481]
MLAEVMLSSAASVYPTQQGGPQISEEADGYLVAEEHVKLYLSYSTSSHPVYAAVGPDGTSEFLPYFSVSDRFRQYSLVTIARNSQEDRQRLHFATTSQGRRMRQRFVSVKRGHFKDNPLVRAKQVARARLALLAVAPVVRFRLESPRATI